MNYLVYLLVAIGGLAGVLFGVVAGIFGIIIAILACFIAVLGFGGVFLL